MNDHRYLRSKRVLDFVLALLLLAVVFPLALVLLIPVRRGILPRFGSVECVGCYGRRFRLHYEVTQPGTSRFGRRVAGSALRCWPVLLGVLSGRVALVGPRLMDVREAAALHARRLDRFAVSPGLVCYWWLEQRAGSDAGTEDEADRRYIANCSLAADCALLVRTLLALPLGRPQGVPLAMERIGGIRLVNLALDEIIDAIVVAADLRVRTRVAFVNPDSVNRAARDPLYRAVLARTDWVCPEGAGMKVAGRILGRPIRQNVNGTDLFARLCAALAARGLRLYLLGARPGVAAAAAAWATRHYPALQIAGTHTGLFTPAQEEAMIEGIRAARTDVVLVAMDSPDQDSWLQRHLEQTGASVGIGAGGLFDCCGGTKPQAPAWLREMGAAWLIRLLRAPGLMWRRCVPGGLEFLWRVLQERFTAATAAGRR